MKVIYDISVLGMGYYHLHARTGIFRVVENIAHGLAVSEDCDLSFCTSLSLENLNQSIDYLQSNEKLNTVTFISPGIEKDIYKNLKLFITTINNKPKPGFLLKVMWKVLGYASRVIEAKTQLLDVRFISAQDVFHSPFHPIPKYLSKEKQLKIFLTVHDLIPILFPHFFEFNEYPLIKKSLISLSSEHWITCISQATKNDLCNYLTNIDPSRVFVTHLAASELFYPCSNWQEITAIKSKYHVPQDTPYILSLSTLEPRKNIAHTIRCFAQLVEQENIEDLYLVLVGTRGWDYSNIFEEISNFHFLKDRIIVTGYVADEDLAALYSGAIAFVYPSLYEGFGLPPLEAMQCGVPVITSNTSSLPEVVGDAGIMVSPTDVDALCQSMLDIYNSSSLREAMSLKSIEQAKQFSWGKCTQETINAYKIALSS